MRRFWRFVTRPAVSVADAAAMGACAVAADSLHLGARWPWWAALSAVWAATIAAVFGIGFVKGFARSAACDVKQWRARRNVGSRP